LFQLTLGNFPLHFWPGFLNRLFATLYSLLPFQLVLAQRELDF